MIKNNTGNIKDIIFAMKKLLLIFASLILSACAQSSDTVYICKGRYAKVYHTSANCSGLTNCKGGIEKVSLFEAKAMGRTPCKKCAQ